MLGRLQGKRIADYFERRWSRAVTTPWGEVHNDVIEAEKAKAILPLIEAAKSVADLGCGGGDFYSHFLAPHGRFERVLGVDVSPTALRRAEATGCYTRLIRCHIEELPAHEVGRFDAVLLGEVLYYLKNYQDALAVASDLVAPGGVLCIALAMGRSYFRQADLALLKAFLRGRRFELVREAVADYPTLLGVPRRYLRVHDQTHKVVLVYREAESRRRPDGSS
jgi:SAM-dependent methyltransferase